MGKVGDDYFDVFLSEMNIDAENISTHSLLHEKDFVEATSIVVYKYISPFVVACSLTASLLTLVLFALLTCKAFEFNAYLFVATLVRVLSFAYQPNTTSWLSNQLGWQYPDSIENESDVFCVASHFLESFLRQVPRYLLAWIAVIHSLASISERLRRLLLRCKHTKDSLITCLVVFLIVNSHYFWSYGRNMVPKNPLLANPENDVHVCMVQRDTMVYNEKDNEIDVKGYVMAGYTWLSEDGLPYVVIAVCSLVCYCYRRCCPDSLAASRSRKIGDTSAGDDAAAAAIAANRSRGVEEQQLLIGVTRTSLRLTETSAAGFSKATIEPDQLPIPAIRLQTPETNVVTATHARVRFTESTNSTFALKNDKNNKDKPATGENSSSSTVSKKRLLHAQFLFNTIPHLELAYLICHAPRLVIWPLKTAVALHRMSEGLRHDEQHVLQSQAGFTLLRVCGELVECSFSVVCLVILLARYERFRHEARWLILYVAGCCLPSDNT